MRRIVIWVVALLVALPVLFVGALWAAQDAMIFPAPRGPLPAAVDGLTLESIATPDGEQLAALWHAPEPAGAAGGGRSEATVLFLHGNAAAIADLAPFARAWTGAGYGFLVPAWRGYPGSTGTPSERGILIDAEAAYDWAAARTDGPIVVYGESLGSGAAVHVASVRDPAALVLEAPYDSVLAVASARFRVLPVGPLLRHPFRSDERIGGVRAPILIVHGDRDGVIPIAHGRALHEAAPEGAEFHEVPGANHFDIGERALPRSLAFVAEAVARRDAAGVPNASASR